MAKNGIVWHERYKFDDDFLDEFRKYLNNKVNASDMDKFIAELEAGIDKMLIKIKIDEQVPSHDDLKKQIGNIKKQSDKLANAIGSLDRQAGSYICQGYALKFKKDNLVTVFMAKQLNDLSLACEEIMPDLGERRGPKGHSAELHIAETLEKVISKYAPEKKAFSITQDSFFVKCLDKLLDELSLTHSLQYSDTAAISVARSYKKVKEDQP